MFDSVDCCCRLRGPQGEVDGGPEDSLLDRSVGECWSVLRAPKGTRERCRLRDRRRGHR